MKECLLSRRPAGNVVQMQDGNLISAMKESKADLRAADIRVRLLRFVPGHHLCRKLPTVSCSVLLYYCALHLVKMPPETWSQLRRHDYHAQASRTLGIEARNRKRAECHSRLKNSNL